MLSSMNYFSTFPKKRKPLPPDFQKIYDRHYLENRTGKTLLASFVLKLEGWLHRKVAEDVRNKDLTTLEIGAGTLNQLAYEKQITAYDIVEPKKYLYENSPEKQRVKTVYPDISEVPANKRYSRITSVATFEHIDNLPEIVAMSLLHLEKEGCMRVSIPNEGTILWKLGTLVTGRGFKKRYDLDYQVFMKYEHINTANEIEEVLQFFFKNVQCSVFGLSKTLAFYRFYECRDPHYENAQKYLKFLSR